MKTKEKKKEKRSSLKLEDFFSSNSSGDQRLDADQSQIIGGDADVDHTQIILGIPSNYCGDISPIPPPVSAPLNTRKKVIGAGGLSCAIFMMVSYFNEVVIK